MSTLAEEFAATPAAVPYTVSVSDVKVSTLANGMKVRSPVKDANQLYLPSASGKIAAANPAPRGFQCLTF